MRLIVSGQPPDPNACARWAGAVPTSPPEGPPASVVDRHQADVRLLPGEDRDAAFERIRGRLFAYDIFSPRLMHFAVCPSGPIAPQTVIVQRLGIGPIRLESAVRVIDTWDRRTEDSREAGFLYVTLRGHPEKGIASFAVRNGRGGTVTLVLEARSAPGTLIARFARPLARRAQLVATKAAMRRLAGTEPSSEASTGDR